MKGTNVNNGDTRQGISRGVFHWSSISTPHLLNFRDQQVSRDNTGGPVNRWLFNVLPTHDRGSSLFFYSTFRRFRDPSTLDFRNLERCSYRMVGFGRILTKFEGEGVDTVQNESIWQWVEFTREKGITQCTILLWVFDVFFWFSTL